MLLVLFGLYLFTGFVHAQNTQLCCATTDYSSSWTYCRSAADPGVGTVTSCSTCMSYQCNDWTAGSNANVQREASFLARTGLNVYLGVGSYGNDQTKAGKCYRFKAAGVNRDLIVQVVNQGGDVPEGNFDLQMSDGGFGIFNACVQGTTNIPMFLGTEADWGERYGGWYDIAGCSKIATSPFCINPSSSSTLYNDNMVTLCQWSFQQGLRTNPTITNMCQVSCPEELYSATGLRRSDEPFGNQPTYTCGTSNPGVSSGGIMTRMMDCAKPSYGYASNVKGSTYPGYEQVIPCRRDGYTRINAFSPPPISSSPSSSPVSKSPSVKPTVAPSSPTNQPVTASPTLAPVSKSPSSSPIPVPTTAPVTQSPTACLCNYGTGCNENTPCCKGLVCVVYSGYSQCAENSSYTKSSNGCFVTASGYGCSSSNQCCNPSGVCTNNFCQLPCSLSQAPSTAPVATSSKPSTGSSAAPSTLASSSKPSTGSSAAPSTLATSSKPSIGSSAAPNSAPVITSAFPIIVSRAPSKVPSTGSPVSASSKSSSTTTYTAVGVVLGVFVIAVIVGLIYWFYMRKSNISLNDKAEHDSDSLANCTL